MNKSRRTNGSMKFNNDSGGSVDSKVNGLCHSHHLSMGL